MGWRAPRFSMKLFQPTVLLHRAIQVSQFIDRGVEHLGKAMTGLVLLTIAVGFCNATLRYIGGFLGKTLTSNALIELQWYLFSILFCIGFAYILKHGSNVRVDFLYSRGNKKLRAWVDLLGTVFFLIPFCVMALWVSWLPVLRSWGFRADGSWGTWEISPDPGGLPRAPLYTMLLVALVLLLLQALSQGVKYVALIQGYVPQTGELLETEVETAHLE